MTPQDDIIAAIVTPIGEGGLSVLRVSGPGAVELSNARFRGKSSLISSATHKAHFGYFVDGSGVVIDEVVATVFKAPHSYTAQDTVELSCHGGIYISRKILESLLQCGARPAEPGEFTKRAFLNGRIDLSQAEAVADLIRCRSEDAHRVSLMQLQGKLSGTINELRGRLLNLCSLLELELDFAEEGLQITDKHRINNNLSVILEEISELINSYKYGKVYREGVRVALVGKPNVGKSSILNALLREDRAIVTEVPGTTRDAIQESITINGVLFVVTDTAGLRQSEDRVEKEGMLRTEREIGEAGIIVYVVEAGAETDDESSLIKRMGEANRDDQKLLVAVNKIDLTNHRPTRLAPGGHSWPVTCISAKTGEGLEELKLSLISLALNGNSSGIERSVMVTNERHKNSLLKAKERLLEAQSDLCEGKSNEFIALRLRLATDSLGEIIGLVTSEDILNNIFANFCIGK